MLSPLPNKPSGSTALNPAKSNRGLHHHGRPPKGGASSPGGLSLLRVTVQLDVSLWWGGNGTQLGEQLGKRQRHQIIKGESSGSNVWSRSWSRSRIRALSSQDHTRVIQLALHRAVASSSAPWSSSFSSQKKNECFPWGLEHYPVLSFVLTLCLAI